MKILASILEIIGQICVLGFLGFRWLSAYITSDERNEAKKKYKKIWEKINSLDINMLTKKISNSVLNSNELNSKFASLIGFDAFRPVNVILIILVYYLSFHYYNTNEWMLRSSPEYRIKYYVTYVCLCSISWIFSFIQLRTILIHVSLILNYKKTFASETPYKPYIFHLSKS